MGGVPCIPCISRVLFPIMHMESPLTLFNLRNATRKPHHITSDRLFIVYELVLLISHFVARWRLNKC